MEHDKTIRDNFLGCLSIIITNRSKRPSKAISKARLL